MSQGNYEPTITDLKEQNVISKEYINKAISTLIPYLIEKVIMIKEFYETKIENFYVWNCSECSSFAENPDKNGSHNGQFSAQIIIFLTASYFSKFSMKYHYLYAVILILSITYHHIS